MAVPVIPEFRSLCVCFSGSFAAAQQEPLPRPDSHETGQGPHGLLFGNWGGERSRLEEREVNFDFQHVSDSLWNLKSVASRLVFDSFSCRTFLDRMRSRIRQVSARNPSIIYALMLSTSATPVFGLAVLGPILGPTSVGTVGLVALAINLTLPPAVILPEMDAEAKNQQPA
jgi:hypothetical protein